MRFKSNSAVFNQALAEVPSNDGVATHLAGRWAAKEAVVKAVSWRKLTMDEIEILPRQDGKGVYALILDRAMPTKKPKGLSIEAMQKMRATLMAATSGIRKQSDERNVAIDTPAAANENLRALVPTPIESDDESADAESDEWLADDDSTTGDVILPQEYLDPPGQIAQVNISHDGEYATAVSLAAEPPADNPNGGRDGNEAG